MKRSGWTMTALLALFLLPASVAPKLLQLPAATDVLVAVGWDPAAAVPLGLLELTLLALFCIPRTAPLGAVLFTALLGGTIATHLRAGSPLASHTLFGVYLGIFLWVALWLRDPALRAFVQGYLRR